MRAWWGLKTVLADPLAGEEFGAAHIGRCRGSRNSSLPDSMPAEDAGPAAGGHVHDHDPRRCAAVEAQHVVRQEQVSLNAEAQFRLLSVRAYRPAASGALPVAMSTAAATAPSAAVLPAAV